MYRFRILVISIFLTITTVKMTSAQESLYSVYVNDISGIENETVDTLIELANEQLVAFDVQLRLMDNTIAPQQWITLVAWDDEIRLDAKSSLSYILQVSPILYPHATPPTCCVSNPFAIMQPFENSDDSHLSITSLLVGLALYQSGNHQDAIELLNISKQSVNDFYLNQPSGLLNFVDFYIANSFIMLEEYESALEYLEPLVQNGMASAPYVINLAWLYIQLNETEVAIELVEDMNLENENVLTSARNNSLIRLRVIDELSHRAQLYALALDYDSAIVDIDEAIRIAEENEISNETLAELYTIRGEIIFLIYEWDRVEDNFNMAIELNPEYDRAYFQRGVLFYTMARREDALADFQTYLDIQPNGIYADEAQSYIESIEIEIQALRG